MQNKNFIFCLYNRIVEKRQIGDERWFIGKSFIELVVIFFVALVISQLAMGKGNQSFDRYFAYYL